MTEEELLKEIADAEHLVKESKMQFRKYREKMDAVETVLIGAKIRLKRLSEQLVEYRANKWVDAPDEKAWDDERFLSVYPNILEKIK